MILKIQDSGYLWGRGREMQPGRVTQWTSQSCLEWNVLFLNLGGTYIFFSASTISNTHTHTHTHTHARTHLHTTCTATRE